jgi:hypothetical protein
MPFYYFAYGLTFRSYLALPFYTFSKSGGLEVVDVDVSIGPPPPKEQKVLVNALNIPGYCKSELYLGNNNQIEVYDEHDSGIVSWVQDGKRVILSANTDLENHLDHLNFFLFTTLMAIIHTRGLFPFHASALSLNGEAMLFLGEKGAGKSTMALEILNKGGQFLADDICLIEKKGTQYYVCPTVPFIKIRAAIFNTLNTKEKDRLFRKWQYLEEEDKYLGHLQLNPEVEPVLLKSVHHLVPVSEGQAAKHLLKNLEKIPLLVSHPSRPNGLQFLNSRKSFLNFCFGLTHLEALPFYRIMRPRTESALPALFSHV